MSIVSKNLQNKLNNLKTNLQVFVDATGRNPTTEEAKEIMETGLTSQDVANAVKYVFELPHEITIPSIEVRHIKNY